MEDVLRLPVEAVDYPRGPRLPVVLALLDAAPLLQQESSELLPISDVNCVDAHICE